MCVILYYTFLGIEITQKTYEIISKKFIIEKPMKLENNSGKNLG
jgi:hypothetical protein